MQPEVRRVVLIPRFSCFAGARTFTTQPIRVRDCAEAAVRVWRGDAQGTTPTFEVAIEQSNDLGEWFELETIDPDAGEEDAETVSFTMDWMRLAVTLGGSNPVVNCWSIAELVMRVPASA